MFALKLRVLLSVFLISTTNHAAAENSALIGAFGGDPGSVVPHGYRSGKPPAEDPTYTLRVASIQPQIKDVFYDTVLTVRTADNIVQRVEAARAYRDFNRCNKAREVIIEKLIKGLPDEYAGPGEGWEWQSADGKVVGRVLCGKRRHDSMPILNLEIVPSP
jgi:hypothetical protein